MNASADRLISSDSHVNPPTEMWAEYLPAEFRDRAPRVERTDEADYEVFEGRRKPIASLSSVAGRRPQDYTSAIRRFRRGTARRMGPLGPPR